MFSPNLLVQRQIPRLFVAVRNDFLCPYTLRARREDSFLLYAYRSNSLFWNRYLDNCESTWNSTEGSKIGSKSNDMIIPIHEEKSIDESQPDAVSFHEVGAEGSEGNELSHFGSGAYCALHAIIDLNLQVEELCIFSFCFCHAMEEVMQEEKVVVKISERKTFWL